MAVEADNVVTEPATSIKFSSSLTVPDSSTTLSLLGVGSPPLIYELRNYCIHVVGGFGLLPLKYVIEEAVHCIQL